VFAQGQKPSHKPEQIEATNKGLGWSVRSSSIQSTLIGITISNNSGFSEIVRQAISLLSSESGGQGRETAVSDQSTIVLVHLGKDDQMLYCRYLGCNPKISQYLLVGALFFPMPNFLAVLAGVLVLAIGVGELASIATVESVANV